MVIPNLELKYIFENNYDSKSKHDMEVQSCY